MSTIDTIRGEKQIFAQRRHVTVVTLFQIVSALLARRRTRLDLADLTDEQLRDIGVTRPAALAEARRSLLDPVPSLIQRMPR